MTRIEFVLRLPEGETDHLTGAEFDALDEAAEAAGINLEDAFEIDYNGVTEQYSIVRRMSASGNDGPSADDLDLLTRRVGMAGDHFSRTDLEQVT